MEVSNRDWRDINPIPCAVNGDEKEAIRILGGLEQKLQELVGKWYETGDSIRLQLHIRALRRLRQEIDAACLDPKYEHVRRVHGVRVLRQVLLNLVEAAITESTCVFERKIVQDLCTAAEAISSAPDNLSLECRCQTFTGLIGNITRLQDLDLLSSRAVRECAALQKNVKEHLRVRESVSIAGALLEHLPADLIKYVDEFYGKRPPSAERSKVKN